MVNDTDKIPPRKTRARKGDTEPLTNGRFLVLSTFTQNLALKFSISTLELGNLAVKVPVKQVVYDATGSTHEKRAGTKQGQQVKVGHGSGRGGQRYAPRTGPVQ